MRLSWTSIFVSKNKNSHLAHPKTKLLIAHGGYNSFLEASKAGVPVILMPLFADQFINAKRAQRFGFCEVLDKLALSPEKIASAINKILSDSKYLSFYAIFSKTIYCSYEKNAKKLSLMLAEKPSSDPHAILKHRLKLATSSREHYALKAAQKHNFFEFYNLDLISIPLCIIVLLSISK